MIFWLVSSWQIGSESPEVIVTVIMAPLEVIWFIHAVVQKGAREKSLSKMVYSIMYNNS